MAIEGTRRATVPTSYGDDRRTSSAPVKLQRHATLHNGIVSNRPLTMAEQAEQRQALLDAQSGASQRSNAGGAQRTGSHPTTAAQLSVEEFSVLRDKLNERLVKLAGKHGLDFGATLIISSQAWMMASTAFASSSVVSAGDIRQIYADARARIKTGGGGGPVGTQAGGAADRT